MDDTGIIRLFESRSEQAISETQAKYSSFCSSIAQRILGSPQDAEECVSDVMLRAWETIPPEHPQNFPAYLSVLTRNTALTRYRARNRSKRGGGELPLLLDELADCVSAPDSVEEAADGRMLREALERFLDGLPAETRMIFVRRYISVYSVKEIAECFDISQSKVKITLMRTRKKLHDYLRKEGLL